MNLLLLSNNIEIAFKYINKTDIIGFIPNARDLYEDKTSLEKEKSKFIENGYKLEIIDLVNDTDKDIINKFNNIDVLYVFGGNSFYLLQTIQVRNLMDTFNKFIKSNKLYIGSSAGSIICGPTLLPYKNWDDITKAPLLKNTNGFNLIDFIIVPHFGRQKYIDKHIDIINNYYDKYKIVLLTDEQGILIKNDQITIINK